MDNIFKNLSRVIASSSDNEYNNIETVDDMNKLITLVTILLIDSPGFITDVIIEPADIIQRGFKEEDTFSLYICYNDAEIEDVSSKISDYEDMIKSLFSDEFSSNVHLSSIRFSKYNDLKFPGLVIYHKRNSYDEISDSTYRNICKLIEQFDVAVSIPVNFEDILNPFIILHTDDNLKGFNIEDQLKQSKDKWLHALKKYDKNNIKKCMSYIYLTNMEPIKYGLPYEYLDKNSPVLQKYFTEMKEQNS